MLNYITTFSADAKTFFKIPAQTPAKERLTGTVSGCRGISNQFD
jgi:hypothetical protein